MDHRILKQYKRCITRIAKLDYGTFWNSDQIMQEIVNMISCQDEKAI